MITKDELTRRRYEHLVDRLEGLLRANLKPEYEGYYGQLILGAERLDELGSTVARTWAHNWLPTRVASSLLVMGPGLGARTPSLWWGGPVEHEPSLQWVGRCLG